MKSHYAIHPPLMEYLIHPFLGLDLKGNKTFKPQLDCSQKFICVIIIDARSICKYDALSLLDY